MTVTLSGPAGMNPHLVNSYLKRIVMLFSSDSSSFMRNLREGGLMVQMELEFPVIFTLTTLPCPR